MKAGENPVGLSHIQNILKNDFLDEEIEKREQGKKSKNILAHSKTVKNYRVPEIDEMIGIFSELWLVKNAQVLSWDFVHPDYGVLEVFLDLLEELDHVEKKVKILFFDSTKQYHFAIPGMNSEMIFCLSLPFIREMNLSKQEISMILLEDFYRLDKMFFTKSLIDDEMKKIAGKNSYPEKINTSFYKKILNQYDKLIYEMNYSFQQQYEITKIMSSVLKSKPSLFSIYSSLIQKKNMLLRSNDNFKNYSRIYPSPEIQLNWLEE